MLIKFGPISNSGLMLEEHYASNYAGQVALCNEFNGADSVLTEARRTMQTLEDSGMTPRSVSIRDYNRGLGCDLIFSNSSRVS